jgi:CRISPR system Cascade subunit CasE
MYLSQLHLNPHSSAARRDLSSPYQLHASLCRAFAAPDEKAPPFLWRLEDTKNQPPTVLVQSASEPNWHRLETEGFKNYFDEPPQSKVFSTEQIQPGQLLRFRLKANPTVTKAGKRHGLKTVEEQLEWLNRQGERGGFTVVGAMVDQSSRLKTKKHGDGPVITVQTALYQGHLKISNLDVFKQTLEKGLGHAKALGLGLLSIAKG